MKIFVRKLWNVIVMRFCFLLFGLGGIVLGLVIAPIVRWCTFNCEKKDLNVQYTISISFRLLLCTISTLRIAKFSFKNFEHLKNDRGCLIIANHPSFIDYVVIVSQLKHCYTMTKGAVAKNFFMRWTTGNAGYVSNAEAEQVLPKIEAVLGKGHNLLIFPEGTRTTMGQPIKLQRGVANLALRLGADIRILHINCTPFFLTKEDKWYNPPSATVQFTVEVGELVDIQPWLPKDSMYALPARRLTEYLISKLEDH